MLLWSSVRACPDTRIGFARTERLSQGWRGAGKYARTDDVPVISIDQLVVGRAVVTLPEKRCSTLGVIGAAS
jgi:hypothetical protein